MKVENLNKVALWSKNGYELFEGNANDIPNMFRALETIATEVYTDMKFEGVTYMLNCWVDITYDENGKRVITIKEE